MSVTVKVADFTFTFGENFSIRKGGVAYTPRVGNTQQFAGANADVRKRELGQGEHRSPPEGYPKDQSQYAVPEYYMFPINNAERTRAAISYFPHHAWKPDEHKEEAAKRILRAAKKFGIDVSDASEVTEAAKGGGGFASYGHW